MNDWTKLFLWRARKVQTWPAPKPRPIRHTLTTPLVLDDSTTVAYLTLPIDLTPHEADRIGSLAQSWVIR